MLVLYAFNQMCKQTIQINGKNDGIPLPYFKSYVKACKCTTNEQKNTKALLIQYFTTLEKLDDVLEEIEVR
jgi:hypothetical protein